MASDSSASLPVSTLVLVESGDLRETLVTCLAEGGFLPTSVLRLSTLEALLNARDPLCPDLVVLDVGRGRPDDLVPMLALLALPALVGVPALLLTTVGTEHLSRLPDPGPLARYIPMPFDVSSLWVIARALIRLARIARVRAS